MSKKTVFDSILKALKKARRILVLTHSRPDGDAYGSQLAMTLMLKAMGKEAHPWHEEGLLEKFNFFPGSDLIRKPPADPESFDTVVAVDTAGFARLCVSPERYQRTGPLINIDHHVSNDGYGDINCIVAKAPATGEILADLFEYGKLPLNREIAENLYAAISTDTGSFQYPSTTEETFRRAADLVRAGVEVGRLSSLIYDNYPRRRILLLKELLNDLHFSCDNQVASIALSADLARKLEVIPEDNEGLIDHIRAIQGVVVAVFFEELPEGLVRISMRSKDSSVDVCKICQQFGGGGHQLAAGAKPAGSLSEIRELVLKAACDEICNRD